MSIVVNACLVALALAIGDALRNVLRIRVNGAERIAFALALGIGVESAVAFALATLAAFRAVPLLACAAMLVAVAIAARDRTGLGAARPSLADLPLAGAIAVPVLALLPFLPAPEIAFDAVYYHLPIARDLARLGSLPYEPYLVFTAFPLGADLLYGVAAMFGALDGARVLQFAAGLACACVAFALASRLRGRRAGAFAAFVWCATPLVMWEMTIAYVDLVAALFVGCAGVAALRHRESREARDAALCGLFLGLGLATKLTVILVAGPLLAALTAVEIAARRGVVAPALATLTLAIAAAPQYLRAFFLTGDPVFPYLNGLFRSPLWEPVNDTFDHLQFGDGNGPFDLVLLPARLVLEPGRFDQNPAAYLLVFPILVAAGLLFALRPRAGAAERLLGAVLGGAVLAWFSYAQYARYLLPAFPIGAALCGNALAALFAVRRHLVARAGASTGVALICVASVPMFLLPFRTVLEPLPLRYDLGHESRDEYLGRVFRHYAMYRWLSASVHEPTRILGVAFSESPLLYCDLPIYRAETTLAGRRVLGANDAAGAMTALREQGFDYVLLDRAERQSDPSGGHVAATEAFARDNLRLVHVEGVLALYAVPPR